MAQRKVTDLTELNETPANGDTLHIVDVSDTTDDATGSSRKITVTNLLSWIANATMTLVNKTLTSPIISQINDANGNEWIKQIATASAVNEVTIANAATGNAPAISATGDDTNINGKLKGKGTGVFQTDGDTIEIVVIDYTTGLTTGDGKAYVTIPTKLNGMNLDKVHARVITAGTTGTTDIQIHNVTDAVDMLSTKLTIDSGETGSDTAATAAVIDTDHDDVATNDLLRVDIDAVSTTAPKGLILRLEFRNA